MASTRPMQGITTQLARELNKPIPLFVVKANPVRFITIYRITSAIPVSRPYFKATLAVEGVLVVESISTIEV
jgi:hypothetical protein